MADIRGICHRLGELLAASPRRRYDPLKDPVPYDQRSKWHNATLNISRGSYKRFNRSQLSLPKKKLTQHNATFWKEYWSKKSVGKRDWAVGE